MRIKGVKLYFSPIIIGVFTLFLVLFILSAILTGKNFYVIWGIPLCLILLILPIVSSFNLGRQYLKLIPEYENAAVPHRICDINQTHFGHAVKVEGTVQSARLQWMGRPRYVIHEGTASIIVFRSYPLDNPLIVGDTIAVLGMVVRKSKGLSIHAVGINKIDELSKIEPEKTAEPEKKDIKIKKYN